MPTEPTEGVTPAKAAKEPGTDKGPFTRPLRQPTGTLAEPTRAPAEEDEGSSS